MVREGSCLRGSWSPLWGFLSFSSARSETQGFMHARQTYASQFHLSPQCFVTHTLASLVESSKMRRYSACHWLIRRPRSLLQSLVSSSRAEEHLICSAVLSISEAIHDARYKLHRLPYGNLPLLIKELTNRIQKNKERRKRKREGGRMEGRRERGGQEEKKQKEN